MNYYNPNYYSMYNNPMPPMGVNQNNLPQQSQMMGLNGKVVDGEDVVKATEVPIGGYGIFPKADLSEVYLKTWNNNGTTSIITYKPDSKDAGMPVQSAVTLDIIAQKIDALESKIAGLKTEETAPPRKENKDAFKL